jgi:LytS/YehU family sensor histidine kinase
MLKTEEEKLVTLREELDFAIQYYDLLKVRFPEGLKVEISVPEECMGRSVVPCALQLLIENATKHNTINPANPLVIRITGTSDSVCVCNDILPKVSKSQSGGLGLKYMKQQYLDLSGKSVDIVRNDDRFCVTIPLL